MRSTLALLALVALAGCEKHEPRPSPAAASSSAAIAPSTAPWPALPEDEASAKELIAARTRRAPSEESPLGSERIDAALTDAAKSGRLRAGWDAIVALLRERTSTDRPSYFLVGTMHDAPAQLVAFRRLFGALGVNVSDAVIEQFHADGRWGGVETRGDSSLLDRFSAKGDRTALDAVIAAQREHNHTAWKYDYLEELPALVATLRASGVGLHGCDMPSALQRRMAKIGDDAALRLRELHCVLSLEERLGARSARANVALLWGAEHVRAQGVQRFLPANAEVVALTVLGGRAQGSEGVEVRLGEPLLIPVEGDHRFVLVLPEGELRASVDRARPPLEPSERERGKELVVVSDRPVELFVGGQSRRVDEKPVSLELSAGEHAFLAVPTTGPRLAGAVSVPEHGFVELELEPSKSGLRVVTHRAR